MFESELAVTKADTVIVLDFETTGLSPDHGDRAIEIGAVRIENGHIVETFQALMNPGRRVNRFIEGYTGISNQMLSNAPPCDEVMYKFADFIEGYNLVAHNASFDKRFLDAELSRISRQYSGNFACSMLAARRIYQAAPNHKLGTLVRYKNIQLDGTFHRALYDSEVTARLWLAMLDDIEKRYGAQSVSFSDIQKLTRTPKYRVNSLFRGQFT